MPLLGVIIEHLEPVLSRWLFLEYKHAARLAKPVPLIITNVKNPREREYLTRYVYAREESVAELGIPPESLIVLDPQAPAPLTPEDFKEERYVVVGGIMGDYPPRGRTKKLLTGRLRGAQARNIGRGQFPIDCAVYMAVSVARGLKLEDIPVLENLEIKTSSYHSIILPYSYPLYMGGPLISREVIEYLLYGVETDEALAVREGRMPSVAGKNYSKRGQKSSEPSLSLPPFLLPWLPLRISP